MKLSSKDRLMLNQGNYIYPEERCMDITKKEWNEIVKIYGGITNPVKFMMYFSQDDLKQFDEVLTEYAKKVYGQTESKAM